MERSLVSCFVKRYSYRTFLGKLFYPTLFLWNVLMLVIPMLVLVWNIPKVVHSHGMFLCKLDNVGNDTKVSYSYGIILR